MHLGMGLRQHPHPVPRSQGTWEFGHVYSQSSGKRRRGCFPAQCLCAAGPWHPERVGQGVTNRPFESSVWWRLVQG